jgi:hypothetical protein
LTSEAGFRVAAEAANQHDFVYGHGNLPERGKIA